MVMEEQRRKYFSTHDGAVRGQRSAPGPPAPPPHFRAMDSNGFSRLTEGGILSAAAQLFFLRSVHKNMVGNRIPGVMNADEQ
jgi:hypothetical protein